MRDVDDWKVSAAMRLAGRMITGSRPVTKSRAMAISTFITKESLGRFTVSGNLEDSHLNIEMGLLLRGVAACDHVWGKGRGPSPANRRQVVVIDDSVDADHIIRSMDQVIFARVPFDPSLLAPD